MIELTQGVTEEIYAKNLTDDTGAALDPTGWAIAAVACQYAGIGPVVATWSDSPSEGQGLAEVVDAISPASGKWVVLHCTPALTDSWTWDRGWLQCVITEPGGEQREARVIDDIVIVNQQYIPEE